MEYEQNCLGPLPALRKPSSVSIFLLQPNSADEQGDSERHEEKEPGS